MEHTGGKAFSPQIKGNSFTAKDQQRHLLSPGTAAKVITASPEDRELLDSTSPCIMKSLSWEKNNTNFSILGFFRVKSDCFKFCSVCKPTNSLSPNPEQGASSSQISRLQITSQASLKIKKDSLIIIFFIK